MILTEEKVKYGSRNHFWNKNYNYRSVKRWYHFGQRLEMTNKLVAHQINIDEKCQILGNITNNIIGIISHINEKKANGRKFQAPTFYRLWSRCVKMRQHQWARLSTIGTSKMNKDFVFDYISVK